MIWEAEFLTWLQSVRAPFLDELMAGLSFLGDYGICGIVVGIVLVIIKKTRRTGFEVLIAMAIAFIIGNLIIKNVVARLRPYDAYEHLEPLVRRPLDWSFPSGHSTNLFACATAIFLNHKKVGVIALIIALLVAFSRLYNCMHFPTDVLAGVFIGVVCAILTHYLIYPAGEKGVRRLRARKEKNIGG